jgi:NTP pyrophosphatase (non-canonical NTP hydrolase)
VNNILADILHERQCQDERWGEQNHQDSIWMLIHGEEYGEVCKAILESSFGNESKENIREELVQLAATCIAHIECIDRRNK